MRVLVTNDDGVDSAGIRALAVALHARGHDILVVAPNRDRSGASAAIGPLHRLDSLPVAEHTWPELPNVRVCAIDAPPATAVFVACLGGFGQPPDVIASGINPGANVGHLVLHSGTVGAALTGAGLGIPGIAVSLALRDQPASYEPAAALAGFALDWVVAPRAHNTRPPVLSLNVPNLPLDEIAGIREARLATFGEAWVAMSATREGGDLKLEFKGQASEPEPGTDRAFLRDGFATVTALMSVESTPAPGAADHIETRYTRA